MNMKKTVITTATLLSVLLFTACASNPTQTLAIQKPNNQYEITGLGKTAIIAKNNAIAAANKTCGRNAAPVLIDEKVEYSGVLKGVVNEKTGQMVTAAATILGSVIGTKSSIEKDTDYQSVITFTCNSTKQ